MNLEDMEIYQISMEIGESIWSIVINWNQFAQNAMGLQIIKSADSIAVNFSEGFGRFNYKDRKRFMYYSRGSLFETKTWLRKARNRKLVQEDEYFTLSNTLEKLGVKLNNYIATIKKKTDK
jgi:four helix bundle protein